MKLAAGTLALSPTDLANYLACAHLTTLDLQVAMRQIASPVFVPLIAAGLRERGEAHEQSYVEYLRDNGLTIADLREEKPWAGGVGKTLAAMKAGFGVIVQPPLAANGWNGRADILRRVEKTSKLGTWSYEPADTKLARETKGATILQLCTYANILEDLQGVAPRLFYVVTPGQPFTIETYQLDHFAAYFRLVRQLFTDRIDAIPVADTYPDPVEHCDICRWWEACNDRRRKDDHLSFIAGAGRLHREELQAQGVATLAAAAATPLPISFKPSQGSRETYQKIREQARVQYEQRTLKQPVHELLLPIEEGQGLARLPAPSHGDLFLDLEGARYAREGGREYLFGVWSADTGYRDLWAFTDAEERDAFEKVMDRVQQVLTQYPDAHIYHFAPYEPSAFKRLMGRYASRANELDELLRAERFVDLYAVVRRALRAGIESYSIKQLEQFYGFIRTQPLADAGEHLRLVERALETNVPAAITNESRAAVAAYNEDDCRSTAALRDWLERLRSDLASAGTPVPRPVAKDGEASKEVGDLEAQQQAARARLLSGLPVEAATPGHPQHAIWLFAYLLDWHRREDKTAWWEYFRLRELPESELFDEPKAIGGLVFDQRVEVVKSVRGKPTGSVIDRYRYPEQDAEIGKKGKLSMPGGEGIRELVAHDRGGRALAARGTSRVF